ncbi:hypothetical protein Tco_1266101 [Tanacetum coccineum]
MILLSLFMSVSTDFTSLDCKSVMICSLCSEYSHSSNLSCVCTSSHKLPRSAALISCIVGNDCLSGLTSGSPGSAKVVAADRLWEHIPTVGLMVVENKRCGVRWIDTHLMDWLRIVDVDKV